MQLRHPLRVRREHGERHVLVGRPHARHQRMEKYLVTEVVRAGERRDADPHAPSIPARTALPRRWARKLAAPIARNRAPTTGAACPAGSTRSSTANAPAATSMPAAFSTAARATARSARNHTSDPATISSVSTVDQAAPYAPNGPSRARFSATLPAMLNTSTSSRLDA